MLIKITTIYDVVKHEYEIHNIPIFIVYEIQIIKVMKLMTKIVLNLTILVCKVDTKNTSYLDVCINYKPLHNAINIYITISSS